MANFDPCDFLFERWKSLATMRHLWSLLTFVFGVALVLLLIAMISCLFFMSDARFAAIMAGTAAIVDCAAVAWVVAQRKDASADEQEAKQELLANCNKVSASAKSLAAGGETETTAEKVAKVEKRLRLFFCLLTRICG